MRRPRAGFPFHSHRIAAAPALYGCMKKSLSLKYLKLNTLDIGLLEMVSNRYLRKSKQSNVLLL
jgi:hypothetical protein